ncbi:MAG: Lrp/AsnC family transcriptional regulator [Promethearchaeota archaeon]
MLLAKIDELDKKIITMLQDDPSITHSQIAKVLSRSQPAIGARIKKLTEHGILATQIGVDFKKLQELTLIKVELTAIQPKEILDMADYCPYVINALKISGETNICMFMACSSLKRLDQIIDKHFRSSHEISGVRMDIVTGFAKQFILPIDFSIEHFDQEDDPCNNCSYCAAHKLTMKT